MRSSLIAPLTYVRYDRVTNLPENFAAIGDAVMRANPSFGQGCAKTAIGAATLDAVLRNTTEPASKDAAWLLPSFGQSFWALHTARTSSIWYSTKAMGGFGPSFTGRFTYHIMHSQTTATAPPSLFVGRTYLKAHLVAGIVTNSSSCA